MSLSNLPTRPSSSFDNPDFVHLKSLSDMCKQIALWATAADAQIQILLAKRAPVMKLSEPRLPDHQIESAKDAPSDSQVKPSSLPTSKAELWDMATNLGVPPEVLSTKDYLNDKSRPTLEGTKRTQDLINKVLDKIALGEDPSDLWVK